METATVVSHNRAPNGPDVTRASDFYETRARQLRNEAPARAIERVVGAGVRLLRRFAAWRERRALLTTLGHLEPWQLKDIGISRTDLQAIADGSFFQDASRRQRAPHEVVISTTEGSWIERELPGIRATTLTPAGPRLDVGRQRWPRETFNEPEAGLASAGSTTASRSTHD